MLNSASKYEKITYREREVLTLIAYEYTAKEIAAALFLSIETIHSHSKNLRRKMNVKNIAGLVRVGVERNLVLKPQLITCN